MKTLNISDEDYDRLVDVLDWAVANADDLTTVGDMGAAGRDRARRNKVDAERMRDLFQPVEYDVEEVTE